MAVILHAVSLAGVCRKGRSSPVPQVRARPEEMRCVGSKRTRELGRDMLLAASIVESSVAKAHGRNRTVSGRSWGSRMSDPWYQISFLALGRRSTSASCSSLVEEVRPASSARGRGCRWTGQPRLSNRDVGA